VPAGAVSGAIAVSVGFVMVNVPKGETPETEKEAGVPATKIAISAAVASVEAVVGAVAGFAANTSVAVSVPVKSPEALIVPKSSGASFVKVNAF